MRYATPSHVCAYVYIDDTNNVRFRNNGTNLAPHKPVPRATRITRDGALSIVCFLNMRDFFFLVRPEGTWDADALRSVEISPNAPIGALHPNRLPFMDWCPGDNVMHYEARKKRNDARRNVDWVTALRDGAIVRIYESLCERMAANEALKEVAARFACSPRAMKMRLESRK